MFWDMRDVPPQTSHGNFPLKRRNGESNFKIPRKNVQNHPDHQALRPIQRATEHGLKKCAWSTAMYDVSMVVNCYKKRGSIPNHNEYFTTNCHQPILFCYHPGFIAEVVLSSPHFWSHYNLGFTFPLVRFRACYSSAHGWAKRKHTSPTTALWKLRKATGSQQIKMPSEKMASLNELRLKLPHENWELTGWIIRILKKKTSTK